MTSRDYSAFAYPLPHPGEHLREDFLRQYGLTVGSLARAMGVRRTRIECLIGETQSITADTALRLGRVFSMSADLWMDLQTAHDLSKTAIEAREALAAIKALPVPAMEDA